MESLARPTLPAQVEAYLLANNYKYEPVDGMVQFVNSKDAVYVTFTHTQLVVHRLRPADGTNKSEWKIVFRVKVEKTWHQMNWELSEWGKLLDVAGVVKQNIVHHSTHVI